VQTSPLRLGGELSGRHRATLDLGRMPFLLVVVHHDGPEAAHLHVGNLAVVDDLLHGGAESRGAADLQGEQGVQEAIHAISAR